MHALFVTPQSFQPPFARVDSTCSQVCGKFFAGRGRLTPAYTHSVSLGHFVFMNLKDGRTYCLPDGYEVRDSSLRDVQFCLSPTFSFTDVAKLNSNTSLARDVYGVSYLPGFMGLNNLNCTDDLSVLLHALAHVTPFRDFWLLHPMDKSSAVSNLTRQFGLVMRKMWSAGNFKSSVSPQELVQEVAVLSAKRFNVGDRADCMELLVWLLRQLHVGLGLEKTKEKDRNAIIYEPFQVQLIAAKSDARSHSHNTLTGSSRGVVADEATGEQHRRAEGLGPRTRRRMGGVRRAQHALHLLKR